MIRKTAGVATIALLGLTLTACAQNPRTGVEEEIAQAEARFAEVSTTDGFLGGQVYVADESSEDGSVGVGFQQPATIDSVTIRCFGESSADLTVTINFGGSKDMINEENIACGEGSNGYEWRDGAEGVEAVSVDGRSADGSKIVVVWGIFGSEG